MNTTKITSIILCQILLLSIIGFAQDTTPDEEKDELGDDAIKEMIQNVNDNLGSVDEELKKINTPEKTNEVLEYIKKKVNEEGYINRESAEFITGKIISKKGNNKKLGFKINKETTVQGIAINDKNLNIKVANKDFQIPLDTIPNSVTGIEVTKDGVSYTLKENGQIQITNPKHKLIEKEGKLIIENYKGVDGEKHDIQISFTQKGRVKFLKDGEIELSGGAVIYDPATETRIELKDKSGATGYLNFYENGHIIRPFKGNNMLITKEREEITFEIKSTNDNGAFIVSEDGINKENYNDFPPKLDKENSFLIDPENKKIFIAEDEKVIGFISGEDSEYKIFGIPGTPQGGILLDGKLAFGKGGIHGTPGNPGKIPGGGGGGGGILGTALPFLAIGGAILAAILAVSLIGGGGDDKKTNEQKYVNHNQTKYKDGDPYQGEDITYNGKEVSTGRPATTKKPTIQSTFDK